jgi:hypothetical protein
MRLINHAPLGLQDAGCHKRTAMRGYWCCLDDYEVSDVMLPF